MAKEGMMEPITWQTASSIISVIGAVVVAVATVLLWRVTGVLAVETKRMADLSSAPHVVATIRPNRWSMMHADLEVENTGNATAYDVQLTFDPPLQNGEARDEMAIPLQKISVLKPGQAISSYLAEFPLLIDNSYRVSVSWLRSPQAAKREVNAYTLDLTEMKNITKLGASDPLVQIADQVKKVQEDLHRVVSGSRKPRIDVFSSADRQAERYEQLRLARQNEAAPGSPTSRGRRWLRSIWR
jgi:hypothetical protein